jgi:hypothetical protein
MSRLEEVLRRAVADLRDAGARFALVGGIAVSARADPRFTRDLDLAVAVPGDAAAEALVAALRARGYGPRATVEQEAVGRLARVRRTPPREPEDGAVVDLLFASSGIEGEIVDAAEDVEVLPGLRVPVATLARLLALKVLSRDDNRCPQDRGDLRALMARCGADDLRAAEEAASLIGNRGYARGRDLVAALRELRSAGAL